MKQSYILFVWVVFSIIVSCSSDNGSMEEETEAEEISPVFLDLASVPYEKLSDYNLFISPISDLNPVFGVIPYEPISALFSDYAHKKRFIWMPKNVSANYSSDGETLEFPIGTILVKNFYYENVLPNHTTKILETRIMIRTETEWIFANYIWNDDQTEAFYNMDGSFVLVDWNENGTNKEVNYRIPNGVECVTCHNQSEIPLPIGTKPQNLNTSFAYETGVQNQLEKLKEIGYLDSYPQSIQTVVDYNDNSEPLELRVRSYLDINCAHCHSDEGFCNYRAPRFSFTNTVIPENLGICVIPDENINPFTQGGNPTHIIKPGDHTKSVIYYRLNTTLENIRMPLRGRTLIHQEAVDLITEWIDNLDTNCE